MQGEAPRGGGYGEGVTPFPMGEGAGEGPIFLNFGLKMVHFGAI